MLNLANSPNRSPEPVELVPNSPNQSPEPAELVPNSPNKSPEPSHTVPDTPDGCLSTKKQKLPYELHSSNTKSTDIKSLKIVLTRISKKSWSTSKNDNRSENSDSKNASNVVTDKATPKPILVCKFCKKKFKTVKTYYSQKQIS